MKKDNSYNESNDIDYMLKIAKAKDKLNDDDLNNALLVTNETNDEGYAFLVVSEMIRTDDTIELLDMYKEAIRVLGIQYSMRLAMSVGDEDVCQAELFQHILPHDIPQSIIDEAEQNRLDNLDDNEDEEEDYPEFLLDEDT